MMFFEKTNKLTFKDTLYGLVPMCLYAIFYLSNIFIHMHNGKISTSLGGKYFVKYDLEYCPIDHKCVNASLYEKKGGDEK